MSHQEHLPQFAYRTILVLEESSTKRQAIESLNKAYPAISENFEWEFIDHPDQISEKLTQRTLVLCGENFRSEVHQILYTNGSPFCLNTDRFLQNYFNWTLPYSWPIRQSVVALFPPTELTPLLEQILNLYGFHLLSMHYPEEVENFFHEPVEFDYVILNIGMNNLDKLSRDRIMKKLKATVGSRVPVSLIKDFSQGSIYEDINSFAKNLSNLILSPEEYLVFLIHFLEKLEYTRLEETIEKNQKGKKINLQISGIKISPLNFEKMKDGKTCYNETIDEKKRVPEISSFAPEAEKIAMRTALTEWLEHFIVTNEGEHQRSLFTFINEQGPASPVP